MRIQKLLILLLITFFSVILFLSCHKYQQDDAYIFYTYARNIAEGNGYVFNLGEKINATTSPLYTLLLAGFYFVLSSLINGLSVPIIGELIGAVSIWLSAFLLYKIFLLFRKERLAILAPIFFLVNPLFRNGSGMESFLVIVLILASMYYLFLKNEELSALFAALAVLSRFDALIFLLVLLIWYIYVEKKIPEVISILIFISVVISWFIFSKYYFGAFLPTSVSIKLQQEKLNFYGTGLIFLKGFLRIFPGGTAIFFLFLAALITSVAIIFIRNRKIFFEPPVVIMVCWLVLYFFIYSFILNPPPYPWYYTPFILLFTVLFTLAANEIYLMIKRRYAFIAFLLFVLAAGIILPVKLMRGPFTPKYQVYTRAAEFLNLNAAPGSSVMIDEIGIFGYFYSKGKVIDAFGLINPQSAERLLQKDYTWTIINYKPDYIITDYPITPAYIDIKNMPQVKDYYKTKIILSKGNQVVIHQKENDFNE